MQLRRAASNPILQSSCNRTFAVLHARRDLREHHVTFSEMSETFPNLAKFPHFQRIKLRVRFTHRSHADKRDWHGIIQPLWMPWIDCRNLFRSEERRVGKEGRS